MASHRNYQPFVRQVHKMMRTHMPIDAWVENIGKKLPILKHDELYEPVTLRIKTSGRIASPDGTVKHMSIRMTKTGIRPCNETWPPWPLACPSGTPGTCPCETWRTVTLPPCLTPNLPPLVR
jgi:hypothetical protein